MTGYSVNPSSLSINGGRVDPAGLARYNEVALPKGAKTAGNLGRGCRQSFYVPNGANVARPARLIPKKERHPRARGCNPSNDNGRRMVSHPAAVV